MIRLWVMGFTRARIMNIDNSFRVVTVMVGCMHMCARLGSGVPLEVIASLVTEASGYTAQTSTRLRARPRAQTAGTN